jgi:hypothetical protein
MIGVLLILGEFWWGAPIHSRPVAEGEVWQLQVCESRVGSVYSRCMPYGPPSKDFIYTCTGPTWEASRQHFPDGNTFCAWLKWADLDTPLGTKR